MPLISVKTAIQQILSDFSTINQELEDITKINGRILAQDIFARFDIPDYLIMMQSDELHGGGCASAPGCTATRIHNGDARQDLVPVSPQHSQIRSGLFRAFRLAENPAVEKYNRIDSDDKPSRKEGCRLFSLLSRKIDDRGSNRPSVMAFLVDLDTAHDVRDTHNIEYLPPPG